MSATNAPFNEREWKILNFLEQEFLAHGALPSAARMEAVGMCSAAYYTEKVLGGTRFRAALLARGIRVGEPEDAALTEQQLTAANTILDLTDNRSRKKKLSDLKISTQLWEAWLSDPAFQQYMRNRAEKIIGNNSHEASLALINRIRSGDMSAVKFYYEFTGRYNPNSRDSVDVPSIIMMILEIIQKHVRDDEALRSISGEMMALAKGLSGTAEPKVIEAQSVLGGI